MIMDRVSHETIYQALYVQTRGGLRADLHRQLSLKRRQRKPRGSSDGRGTSLYAEAFTISQRPAEVADRAVPGHWEGDLILGTGERLRGRHPGRAVDPVHDPVAPARPPRRRTPWPRR